MEPGKIYILHDIGKTELTPEEAKEHLEGEELPPNMKKIIEGVGKMSKLDDISRRYFNHTITQAIAEEGIPGADEVGKTALVEFEENAVGDIGYLLSRLAIAEKALENVMGVYDNVADDMGALRKMNRYADDALKQIRE